MQEQKHPAIVVWERLEELAESLMNEEHEFVLAAAEITHRAMEDCEIIEWLCIEGWVPQELFSSLAAQCETLKDELDERENFKITPREEIAKLVDGLVEKLEELTRLFRSTQETK